MKEFRRRKECPNCHVDWWAKDYDFAGGELAPVWKCPNCHHREPRRKNKVGQEISPSQEKALAAVKARLLSGPGELEVKSEEHSLHQGIVIYKIHYGYKGDEGNGLMLCRKYFSVCIGRGGGLFSSGPGGKWVHGEAVFSL